MSYVRQQHTTCKKCGSSENKISGGRTYCNKCRNIERIPVLPDPAPQDPPSPHWYKRAACLGADRRIFFEDQKGTLAKPICNACPVREACLDAAVREEAVLWPMGYRDTYGFRGGLFPYERLKLVMEQVKADNFYHRNDKS